MLRHCLNIITKGLGLISYFGHGASTTIGYNQLIDPSIFNYNDKYPVIFTSGCDVGDCYSYMPARMTTLNNITERYLFNKNKGSVGFVAETYLGVTSFLNFYNTIFYNSLALANYGKPITASMHDSQVTIIAPSRNSEDSITNYAHAEQTNFFGDPAISLYNFSKPDFAIEKEHVEVPKSASIKDGKFHVKARVNNIGRATESPVHVSILQKKPNGDKFFIFDDNLVSFSDIDTLDFDVLINPNSDVGYNEIVITIDDDNKYDELSETNNTVTKSIYIYANGITPIYPYKYSIIRDANSRLVASTSDALASEGNYVMELDTTQLFNSSFLISKTVKSIGGAISFDPGVTYRDSTVYYWRVSPVPTSGEEYRWASSNFQYIPTNGSDNQNGVGQSHIYQQLNSDIEGLNIDSDSRHWDFDNRNVTLVIGQAVVGPDISTGYSNFKIILGTDPISSFYCTKLNSSLMFNIFDPNSFKPYINQKEPATVENGSIGGFMGATSACKTGPYSYDTDPAGHPNTNKSNFQFSYQTEEDRTKIASFVDWIPDGAYVVMRLFVKAPFTNVPLINSWKKDVGGSNNLYSTLIKQGLTSLNEFTQPQGGIFIFRKNDQSFDPIQKLTGDVNGQLLITETLVGKDSIGYVTSPKFGPAKSWSSIQWNGKSEEATSTDHASIDVIGIRTNGSTTVLRTLNSTQQDVDISSIDANTYPYLQLKLRNVDSINYTPYQLRYWHIMYSPVPEGALAGNLGLQMQDTIDLGEDYHFSIAFKNVSDQLYSDSIKATVTIKDTSSHVFAIPVSRLKPLAPGDTAMLSFTIPGYYKLYNQDNPTLQPLSVGTSILAGGNLLSVSLNPDNEPLEQTLDNNSLAKRFFVKSNPVPVDFGKLSASLLSDYKVHLSWHVLTAINSDYYIIQRSVDGKVFKEVARQKSRGDGTNDVIYSALDNISALPASPSTVFYRIVGIDKAGHHYYSAIASVYPIWDNWSFSIAPNPITQDKLQILLSSKDNTPVEIRLLDMSGRPVLQQKITPGKGGKISINTPHLAAGIYLVQITQGTHKASAKLIRK